MSESIVTTPMPSPRVPEAPTEPPSPSPTCTWLEPALNYLEAGFSLVPLQRADKQPLVSWKAFQKKRPTASQLHKWAEEYPDSNLGVITGAISNLVVVDLDTQDAIQWASDRGLLIGPRVRTGRGMHCYFRHPSFPVRNQTGKIEAGCDIKGDGGYVVLPPSTHSSGKRYEWVSDFKPPLPHLPTWLLKQLQKPVREASTIKDLQRYALKVLSREAEKLRNAEAGTRNDTLNIAAFNIGRLIRDGGLTHGQAEEELLSACESNNLAFDEPGETARTLYRGLRDGMDAPRGEQGSEDTALRTRTKERKLAIYGLDDLDALPDPEWMIDGVLPKDSLGLLYGQPGVKKTFVALDMALSIASGIDWHGRVVRKGSVLYIYGEGLGIKRRTKAWRHHHGQNPKLFRTILSSVALSEASELARLIEAIDTHMTPDGAPEVIVIDTLARCFSGDENTVKDMTAFIAALEKLREIYPRSTVLIVHHEGKGEGRGARGSSALTGAIATSMHLSDANGVLALTCEKQRDAEEFSKIMLKAVPVNVPGASSPDLCIAPATTDDVVFSAIMTTRRDEAGEAIVGILSSNGALRYSEIMAALESQGVKRSTGKTALQELEKTEKVRKGAGKYELVEGQPTDQQPTNNPN